MQLESDTILKLAPGVWIRNAVDNCLWADLGDGVLVVDALEDRAMCPIIPEDIEATAHKPMRWLVNTHADTDHITCNAAWAEMGATVIAHEKVKEAMAGRKGSPEITFADRYTVEGSRHEAELEWAGGAHTAADTLVYLPWARVLHVGDLFGWGLIPMAAITPETAGRLRAVMQRILEFDADILVCGHGPVLGLEHIRRFLDYVGELRERVGALVAEGRSADEIKAAYPPPADMADWWRFADWKHHRNIDILLRSTP